MDISSSNSLSFFLKALSSLIYSRVETILEISLNELG